MRALRAIPVIGLGLILTACGSGAGKSAAQHHGSKAVQAPAASAPSAATFARLGDIQNYAFTYRLAANFAITGEFHDPNDYQVDLHGVQERYINGVEYVNLGKWMKSTGTKMDPLAQVALQMQDLLHVTGIKVAALGACTFAGRPGHKYSLSVSGAGLGEAFLVCADDATGGLLSGAAAVVNHTGIGPTKLGEDFYVTKVGGVPYLPVP